MEEGHRKEQGDDPGIPLHHLWGSGPLLLQALEHAVGQQITDQRRETQA